MNQVYLWFINYRNTLITHTHYIPFIFSSYFPYYLQLKEPKYTIIILGLGLLLTFGLFKLISGWCLSFNNSQKEYNNIKIVFISINSSNSCLQESLISSYPSLIRMNTILFIFTFIIITFVSSNKPIIKPHFQHPLLLLHQDMRAAVRHELFLVLPFNQT